MGRPSTTFGELKKCSNCFELKPFDDFYIQRRPNGNVNRQSRCKGCNNEVVAGYKERQRNGEVKRYNTKFRSA